MKAQIHNRTLFKALRTRFGDDLDFREISGAIMMRSNHKHHFGQKPKWATLCKRSEITLKRLSATSVGIYYPKGLIFQLYNPKLASTIEEDEKLFWEYREDYKESY